MGHHLLHVCINVSMLLLPTNHLASELFRARALLPFQAVLALEEHIHLSGLTCAFARPGAARKCRREVAIKKGWENPRTK